MSADDVVLWGDAYYERIERNGADFTECVVCGRKARGMLHVDADSGPHSYGDEMGWHPIGSECAKRARAAGWTVRKLEEFS